MQKTVWTADNNISSQDISIHLCIELEDSVHVRKHKTDPCAEDAAFKPIYRSIITTFSGALSSHV
jgi:hypothetical protein